MKAGQKLYELIERLFPINRSITGNGVRETLSIISDIIPLDITEIPSGTRVFDWEIPNEWNIKDAWVKDPAGKKIIDFQKSNLHVLNYSIAVRKKVDLAELKEHLYSIPEFPDWTPYRTSYYHPNWGFCLPYSELQKLREGEYEVMIDATLEPGALTYGEYYIKGQTEKEILISTHICHPSLANDNLSGIAVSAFLARWMATQNPKYSYRFVFIPATIGAIAWLSKNEQHLSNIQHGLVLTLLGDSSDFHYKNSRRGNAEIDQVVSAVLRRLEKQYKIIDYVPYGYDERQYCSPAFNLPVGRLSRKPHGEFPEYHTSADNLEFVKPDKLEESYILIQTIIEEIESRKKYINLKPKGEPKLGKYGLFKKIGGDAKDLNMALLWMLNMSDGDHSVSYIASLSGLDIETIEKAAQKLVDSGLMKEG